MRNFSTKFIEITYYFLIAIRFAIYTFLVAYLCVMVYSVVLIFLLLIILFLLFFYLLLSSLRMQKILNGLEELSIFVTSSSKVKILEIEKFHSYYNYIIKSKNILFLPVEKVFLDIILKKYEDERYTYIRRASYKLSLEAKGLNFEVDNLKDLFVSLISVKKQIDYINEYIVFSEDDLSYSEIKNINYNLENLNFYLENSQKFIKNILLKQYETIIEHVKNKDSDGDLLQLTLFLKDSIKSYKGNFNLENIKLAENIMQKIKVICQFLVSSNKLKNTTLEYIDSLDGYKFEEYCAMLLSEYGFTNLFVTKGSGDKGVDIIGYLNGKRYAIQCKCYSNKLGNSPIQEVVAGKNFYGCTEAIVITNNYFTNSAIELAEANNVLLWDREVLRDILYKVDYQWKALLEHLIKF